MTTHIDELFANERVCLALRFVFHMVRQSDASLQPLPQDDQLKSEHRILSLKPALGLERRGQQGQNR
jgi:hypothetical protein